jgi:glutaredoxin 3
MASVTIYAKPGCPYCAAAKEDLRRRGVAFVEHDVLSDPAALRRMLELNGGRRNVPTIVDGERVTVGFGGY